MYCFVQGRPNQALPGPQAEVPLLPGGAEPNRRQTDILLAVHLSAPAMLSKAYIVFWSENRKPPPTPFFPQQTKPFQYLFLNWW
jgi:hypothetical protein